MLEIRVLLFGCLASSPVGSLLTHFTPHSKMLDGTCCISIMTQPHGYGCSRRPTQAFSPLTPQPSDQIQTQLHCALLFIYPHSMAPPLSVVYVYPTQNASQDPP